MILKIQDIITRLAQSIFAIIKILILSRFKSDIKYKKQERGCLVLLNGPSLTDLIEKHPTFIENKDLISVNFFPATALYTKLKPESFIISAPELWLKEVDQIYIEKRRNLVNDLIEKTSWPLKIMIPFAAKRSDVWRGIDQKNKNIELLFYNDTGIEGFQKLIFWFFRKGLAMPRPHNIIVPSLINSINMGYKRIYLWGAENNQFLHLNVDENNNALINQKHYYDKDHSKPGIMRRGPTGQRRLHEILHKFMLSFKGYHIINDYAHSRGVNIINQTPGSMIDAFERERLD